MLRMKPLEFMWSSTAPVLSARLMTARIPCTSVPSPANSGSLALPRISAALATASSIATGLPPTRGERGRGGRPKKVTLFWQPFLMTLRLPVTSRSTVRSSHSRPQKGQVTFSTAPAGAKFSMGILDPIIINDVARHNNASTQIHCNLLFIIAGIHPQHRRLEQHPELARPLSGGKNWASSQEWLAISLDKEGAKLSVLLRLAKKSVRI